MIIFMSLSNFYFLPLFSDSRGMYIFIIIRTFREGEGEEEEGGARSQRPGGRENSI